MTTNEGQRIAQRRTQVRRDSRQHKDMAPWLGASCPNSAPRAPVAHLNRRPTRRQFEGPAFHRLGPSQTAAQAAPRCSLSLQQEQRAGRTKTRGAMRSVTAEPGRVGLGFRIWKARVGSHKIGSGIGKDSRNTAPNINKWAVALRSDRTARADQQTQSPNP
jgi:hypothetical protein